MKLDLASDSLATEGYEGVDLLPHPGVVHVVDLLTFPWPFPDASVEELRVSHFLEHIPHGFLRPDGSWTPRFEIGAIDLLCAFYDECFRVLEPGGTLRIVVPQSHNDRAFADPTHCRFFVPASFLFLSRAWRESVGIAEHRGYCRVADFPFDPDRVKHTFPAHTEAQLKRIPGRNLSEMHYERLNIMEDIDATFVKPGMKPLRPVAVSGERLETRPQSVEDPHLFRVTGGEGGFVVRPGNMTLPGDAPLHGVIGVKFDQAPAHDPVAEAVLSGKHELLVEGTDGQLRLKPPETT